MSLKSHRDLTKEILVVIQQEYDDAPVTFSCMAEVDQEVAGMLPIFPLLLEGWLGMNVSRYFCSSYTIGTEGYQWNSTVDKVIPIDAKYSLEEIDRHWIQHADDFKMRNKYYKDENYGGYTINIGFFDKSGELGRPRIMEDGNESLQTMGLNRGWSDNDSYMDIELKGGKTPATDSTEVSTFTTETLPLSDEKLLDILSKNQDSIPPELLE